MAVTKSYANTMLSGLFTNAYIGLSTTQPQLDGTGATEPPSNAGYTRVAASGGSFTAADGTISNRAYLYFPEATAAWGTVLYLCVFEGNSSTSKLRYYGALTSPKAIEVNSVPLFRPGSVNVSIVEG